MGEYSEIRLKGFVEPEVHLHNDYNRYGLMFYIRTTFGKSKYTLDPICCVAYGENANTVLQAAMEGFEVLLEGSFFTDMFSDHKTHRLYEMTCVSVKTVSTQAGGVESVMSATATGWLHEMKRHKDRDGDVYYTFILSQTEFYENGNYFRCLAPDKVGSELSKLYDPYLRNPFRLEGMVTCETKPCRKGKARMTVHSFERLAEPI